MTPTGAPAWTRTTSHTFYGGDVNKTNFLSQGAVDPTTDVVAEELARLAADLEALVRTAPFAVIRYLNNDASPAAPTIEFVCMMTGVRLVSYAGDAAPSGFPSAARNGTGDVTFTFASSYSDDYGVSGSFGVSTAEASPNGQTAFFADADIVTATTVRVKCFDAAGAAIGDKRVTLEIG